MNDPFANQGPRPHCSEVVPDIPPPGVQLDATPHLDSVDAASAAARETLQVTYFPSDSSVFFNSRYVTKAVPGRILWRLLTEISETGRRSFTNRELRHEPELRLPAARDNLETRLLLLRRILESRFPRVRICRTGRGHFRVDLDCPVDLQVGS